MHKTVKHCLLGYKLNFLFSTHNSVVLHKFSVFLMHVKVKVFDGNDFGKTCKLSVLSIKPSMKISLDKMFFLVRVLGVGRKEC